MSIRRSSFSYMLIKILIVFCFFGSSTLLIQVIANTKVSFNKITITDEFDGVLGVYTADIDGDGDLDILGSAHVANELAWWANDDLSFTKHIITDNFEGAAAIWAADIDTDGDLDILGAAHAAGELAWWENDDLSFTKHSNRLNY
ncbi:MAG: hypothetical protein ACFE8U_15945, partial [Candidatus Hermodarchaeota archaeon]